jgi:DNA invertase Pin-like site-specific DNA recombinase
MVEANSKVTESHLKRDAYLYVRQSTIRQVFENSESTKRQYALRQRAVALGWPLERVHVIDSDLGQSGASAVDRKGFQKLVAETSMGRAGIVLGLEVSRLARNSTDWHRLLEICALSDTLILDEDGLYNPNAFNDRLLLGLKGAMSEAELHLMRARLRGGLLNKARRGELAIQLPVGFVYDSRGRVQMAPDRQVREAITLFFQTFRRLGSALAIVKFFREQGLSFPRRLRTGPGKGKLVWGNLVHSRALQLLHNPRYAGTFFYGRRRTRKGANGKATSRILPQDEWHVLIPGAHKGYIPWEEYEDNQKRLRECAQAYGKDRRKSPPREGPALLQGIVVCGICGHRMTVRYYKRKGGTFPSYVCQRDGIEDGIRICQHMPGVGVDKAIGKLLLETLTPMTLEVTLAVQQELSTRLEEADRLRAKQVERCRYEAELARQRYMQVDPHNRLVADELEAEWNEKLRGLQQAQEEYERQRQADRAIVDEEVRARVMALATDFPRLWNDPNTPHRDRKRLVRLLIEDVTLARGKDIKMHVRFKGGTAKTITLSAPMRIWETWRTPSEVVEEIDSLLNNYSDGQIAAILNKRGLRSGKNRAFHNGIITRIRKVHGLRNRYERLREKGMLRLQETAEKLAVSPRTVKRWHKHGLLRGYAYNEKNECLYEIPETDIPMKNHGQKLSERRRLAEIVPDGAKEVQYEA